MSGVLHLHSFRYHTSGNPFGPLQILKRAAEIVMRWYLAMASPSVPSAVNARAILKYTAIILDLSSTTLPMRLAAASFLPSWWFITPSRC